MSNSIIGRESEQKCFQEVFSSKKAEFIAVYGRRRIGKTYLIENFFKYKPCAYFQLTGINKGTLKEHLGIFTEAIQETFFSDIGLRMKAPDTWMDAFHLLTKTLTQFSQGKKIVLFFDELPWLASNRSGFLKALDHYWNTKWSKNNDFILIVCGSAASWMIKKIINDKGGLHNRITLQLPMYPFTLKETEHYLHAQKKKYNRSQILELYMALGGVAHYLEMVKKNLSATQNISQLCFNRTGALLTEFEKLFSSLFNNAPAYIEIVKVISKKRNGLLRKELEKKLKLSDSGGTLTEKLNALEQAGFIQALLPMGRSKRGVVYKLMDEYCLFYLKWVEPIARQIQQEAEPNYWASQRESSAWRSWSGYAFEAVCLKHISQCRKALFIPNGALAHSWHYLPTNKSDNGAQIDLLFDRNDGVVTLCEIKYCQQNFEITKSIAENIQNKIAVFKQQTKTKKQIFVSMITANPLVKNRYSEEMITSRATLEDLFV